MKNFKIHLPPSFIFYRCFISFILHLLSIKVIHNLLFFMSKNSIILLERRILLMKNQLALLLELNKK